MTVLSQVGYDRETTVLYLGDFACYYVRDSFSQG